MNNFASDRVYMISFGTDVTDISIGYDRVENPPQLTAKMFCRPTVLRGPLKEVFLILDSLANPAISCEECARFFGPGF